MENKEYLKRVEELFQKVEDKLDEYEDDIDYDHTPDKLMLNFEGSGKKVVLNTQRAIKEICLLVIQGHGIFSFYRIRTYGSHMLNRKNFTIA